MGVVERWVVVGVIYSGRDGGGIRVSSKGGAGVPPPKIFIEIVKHEVYSIFQDLKLPVFWVLRSAWDGPPSRTLPLAVAIIATQSVSFPPQDEIPR